MAADAALLVERRPMTKVNAVAAHTEGDDIGLIIGIKRLTKSVEASPAERVKRLSLWDMTRRRAK
jgi:hypothetical protein